MKNNLKPGKLYRVVQEPNYWDDELICFNNPEQVFNYCFATNDRFNLNIHKFNLIEFSNAFLYLGIEKYHDKPWNKIYSLHKFLYAGKVIYFSVNEDFKEVC